MQYVLKHLFFARWKWIQMQCGVLVQRPLCWYLVACVSAPPKVFSLTHMSSRSLGKLLPLQPPAWRPVTLRVSLKRYSRFTPPGLGEHSLHFRTINIQFVPVSALPIALGRSCQALPSKTLAKHRRGGCVERGTKEGNETNKEINTFAINKAFGGRCEQSFEGKVFFVQSISDSPLK